MVIHRFDIIVSGEAEGASAAGGKRRRALGRFGSLLATVLSALLAIGLVTTALVVGYLIAGLVLAVLFLVLLLAMARTAFLALRR